MNRIIACLVIVCVATLADAQNSSLLHVSAPEMARLTPRGLPGMSVVQAQDRTPEFLPAPQPDGSRPSGFGTPSNSGRGATAVMPPEFVPPMAPPSSNVSPRNLPNIDPAIAMRGVSWTYQPAPPLRQFHVQDIVTIRVDEISRTMAEGDAQKRRNSLFSAVLSDWIKITRAGIVPDPMADGDPTVASQSQSNFRAEASIESRESFTFSTAARIVDIRPNGNLVLEAREKFRHNDNLWETTLSGICRAQDVGPDNVVLSGDLIDLEIQKEDQGYIRDGYRRGWFQRFFDHVKPF